MPSLSSFRQDLKGMVGDVWEGAATSDSNGTVLVSTDLSASALVDNAYRYQWALITSGTYAGTERMISAYSHSQSTITFARPIGGNLSSGTTFEISRIKPSLYARFINQALKTLYPRIHRRIEYRGLIGGGLIFNDDFEDWISPTAAGWWKSSAIERNVSELRYGDYCAKLTGAGSQPVVSFTPLTDAGYPPLSQFFQLGGRAITWQKYVKCQQSNAVKLVISAVGVSGQTLVFESSLNSGGPSYGLLSVTAQLPVGLSAITFALMGSTSVVFYADSGFCESPFELYTYPLPPDYDYIGVVLIGHDWKDTYDGYEIGVHSVRLVEDSRGRKWLKSEKPFPSGRRLKVVGYGRVADLVSDNDSVNLNALQSQAVCEMAASNYYTYLSGLAITGGKDKEEYINLSREFRARADRTASRCAMPAEYSYAGD